MKFSKIIFAAFVALIAGLTACSDFNDHITPAETAGVHPEGFGKASGKNSHAQYIAKINYDLNQCKECHGADYNGGTAGVSCLTCHTQPSGPEACNTCHGNPLNPKQIAPPLALDGSSSTTDKGVGAHSVHLSDSKLTTAKSCDNCHSVPVAFGSPGHIDQTPGAEVALVTVFKNNPASPVYDKTSLTCANIYCHGSFSFAKDTSSYQFEYADSVIVGENPAFVWNKVDGTQSKCGSCHLLPPKGHVNAGTDPEAKTCSACHYKVVNPDGTIKDISKHINGRKNVFGK